MGFYAQKKSQTAPVTSVSVDDLEIGKDEDVVNIKGTKVLLSGIGFYSGEEDGCILIGNYQEWLTAGKPVMQNTKVLTQDTQVYSTEETNTGKTWIDGQPIYRKVVVVELNTKPNSTYNIPTGINGVNYVNIVGGVMEMGNYSFSIYYSNNADVKYNTACYYNKLTNQIVYNFGENRLNSVIKKITFIIEYTKL